MNILRGVEFYLDRYHRLVEKAVVTVLSQVDSRFSELPVNTFAVVASKFISTYINGQKPECCDSNLSPSDFFDLDCHTDTTSLNLQEVMCVKADSLSGILFLSRLKVSSIYRVNLTNWIAQVKLSDLSSLDWTTVSYLNLSKTNLSDPSEIQQLRMLQKSNVRVLNLNQNEINTPHAIKKLKVLQEITELRLAYNSISSLEAILKLSILDRLNVVCLDLTGNQINTPNKIMNLGASLSKITHLRLGLNLTNIEDFQALKFLQNVTHLDLSDTQMNASKIRSLSLLGTKVHSLSLRHCWIREEWLDLLANSLKDSAVVELDLTSNLISRQSKIEEILELFKHTDVTTIYLERSLKEFSEQFFNPFPPPSLPPLVMDLPSFLSEPIQEVITKSEDLQKSLEKVHCDEFIFVCRCIDEKIKNTDFSDFKEECVEELIGDLIKQTLDLYFLTKQQVAEIQNSSVESSVTPTSSVPAQALSVILAEAKRLKIVDLVADSHNEDMGQTYLVKVFHHFFPNQTQSMANRLIHSSVNHAPRMGWLMIKRISWLKGAQVAFGQIKGMFGAENSLSWQDALDEELKELLNAFTDLQNFFNSFKDGTGNLRFYDILLALAKDEALRIVLEENKAELALLMEAGEIPGFDAEAAGDALQILIILLREIQSIPDYKELDLATLVCKILPKWARESDKLNTMLKKAISIFEKLSQVIATFTDTGLLLHANLKADELFYKGSKLAKDEASIKKTKYAHRNKDDKKYRIDLGKLFEEFKDTLGLIDTPLSSLLHAKNLNGMSFIGKTTECSYLGGFSFPQFI